MDDLGGVLLKLVRKLFVIRDQMRNVDITVVLLDKYVLADLVSVEEDVVEMEVHDKVDQLLLDSRRGGAILTFIARLAAKDANRVCRLPVRHGVCCGV